METHTDLAIIVAKSQERLGSLTDKISALHTRQDKMEEEIKTLLKELSLDMKDLKKSIDAKLEKMDTESKSEFKTINEFINRSKGKMAILAVIATIVGGFIGRYLIK